MRVLTGILFWLPRGLCSFEPDGAKQFVEIVDDLLIQAVEFGALGRLKFGIGAKGPN